MPTARMLPWEVLTLALTPSRALLNPLRNRLSAQCIANHTQRRLAHLYVYARSRTLNGLHPLLPFGKYSMPLPSHANHKIEIWEDVSHKGRIEPRKERLVAADVSFEEALEKFVKEGEALGPFDDLKSTLTVSQTQDWEYIRDNDVPSQYNRYCIVKQGTTPARIGRINSKKKEKGFVSWYDKRPQPDGSYKRVVPLKPLREQHLLMSSSPAVWHETLDRMYQLIERGHPVEVSVKIFSKKIQDPVTRVKGGDLKKWPWMHNHFPHARPDFILKAMPKGTYFMIEPFCDGKVVQWVMAPELPGYHRTFTHTLLHLKEQLKYNLDNGLASRVLPSALKERLKFVGHPSFLFFSKKKDKRDRELFVAERTAAKAQAKKEEREAEKLEWKLKAKEKRERRALAALRRGEEPSDRPRVPFKQVIGPEGEKPSVVRTYVRRDYQREDEGADLVIKYVRSHQVGRKVNG